jgi:Tfp pilus assembly protein PilX
LPWVSRRAYEAVLDHLGTAEAALRVSERRFAEAMQDAQAALRVSERRFAEAMQDAQKERQDLVAKYDALAHAMGSMVREGLHTTPALPEVKPPEPLPPAVDKAIDTVALDPPTRAHLERLAWRMLGDHASPEAIAERIMAGEEVSV